MTTLDGSPSPGGTHEHALWDAAYVLGSLSSSQRQEFEAHLRVCRSCTEAVGELSGVPALLSQIDRTYVDTIDEHDPRLALPPLRGELLAKVSSRRRRSRALAWMLAATAAAAIGIFVAIESNPIATNPMDRQAAASALAMTPTKPVPLRATVTLSSRAWGTHIEMNCTYIGPTGIYFDSHYDKLVMVAVGRDGSHVQLATWTAHAGIPASLGGSTAMPIDQIASVQIVSANAGAVLLRRDL
ncbi:anti-sigma factor family protein [Mycolicibacterium helvum]|uniref:Anti-sigma-L factor RslA n=1 Tax=Mycolicibacterium helvum TaxID=1534349 RepID=A0A7I7TFN5_9MYCO|nr:zf-HC2 domain-containing protein [Mycolicibacterium helvum]BBY67185.1 anti-sigma-L factor RslA [Mycolicibacterium helvum]